MALNQSYKKGDTFLVPEDSHIARLYSAIDIGLQETGFRKIDSKTKEDLGPQITNQVLLTFELQDVLLPDGRPAAISGTFTSSLSDKAKLKPILHALLGGTSEAKALIENEEEKVETLLAKAIGQPLLLSVVHKESKGSIYANVGGAMPLPKAMKAGLKEQVNKNLLITDVDNISPENQERVHEWIQKRIDKRLNKSGGSTSGDMPF